MQATIWTGDVSKCDICRKRIEMRFVDGRLRRGSWALMCLDCHRDYGVGLGMGKGQMYELQTDGSYMKIDG